MPTVYLTEQRSTVRRDGETLLIQIPEDETTGRRKQTVRIPLIKVDQVVVHGNITLTAPALETLLARGIGVSFCSVYGQFRGRLEAAESRNGLLRVAQYGAHADPTRRLALAQTMVAGKLHNQRTLLLRSNRKRGSSALADAADAIAAALGQVAAVNEPVLPPLQGIPDRPVRGSATGEGDMLAEPRPPDDPLARLMGLEGSAAAAYFSAFPHLLHNAFGFAGRARRPPTDPVNALLSYGYTLLMHQVRSAIHTVGLDPYVAFLHGNRYGRPSLALDLMEEFRPVLVDSVVMRAINTGVLSDQHFNREAEAVRLTPGGRKLFLAQWEQRLGTEIRHPVFDYTVTYRRCLELQARLLTKALTGDIPAYPPFKVR